jgi:hypothetical protein
MSSESMDDVTMSDTSPILSLPVEIVEKVLGQLAISDLKNLRLTCKAIEHLAARHVFNTCILQPKGSSIKKMCQLYKNDRLKDHVRCVVYCVMDGWYDCMGDFEFSGDESIPSEHTLEKDPWLYERLLEKKRDLLLFRFNDIKSVEIQFHPFHKFRSYWRLRDMQLIHFDYDIVEDDSDMMESQTEEEAICFAHDWLDKFFSTIYKSGTRKRLTSLTITNLINYPLHLSHDPSSKFRPLLRRLKELHLSIDTMTDGIRQNDVGRARFIDHLCNDWFPHCSERLTSLTLHMTSYWGPCLSNDFEDLRFPRLRHLTLWNYAFVYKSQFEWILRHNNLESLSLIACPIVVHMEIDHVSNECTNCRLFDPDRFEGNVITTSWGTKIFRNSVRWSSWLTRVKNNLIRLKEFQMCGGHQHELAADWFDRMDETSKKLQLKFEDSEADQEMVYEIPSEAVFFMEDDEMDIDVLEDPDIDSADCMPKVRTQSPRMILNSKNF